MSIIDDSLIASFLKNISSERYTKLKGDETVADI